MVTHFGGKSKKSNFMIIPRNLPKMLAPGEYAQEWTDDLSFLNRNLLYLCAIDSLGEIHKAEKRVIRKLVKESQNRIPVK